MNQADKPETGDHTGVVRRVVGSTGRSPGRAARGITRGIGTMRQRIAARRGPMSWVLATCYLPIAVAEVANDGARPLLEIILVALGCSAPVALVMWRPWVAWLVAFATVVWVAEYQPMLKSATWPWPVAGGIVVIVMVVAVAVAAPVMVTAVIAFATSLAFGAYSTPDSGAGWAVGILLFAVGGLLIRWRAQFRRELDRQEELSEVEKARRTVLEERARIARDLHDVVAHRMSLVVVAAETAPYRVPDVSEPMRAELAAIGATAREALIEMRGLLGVLRGADERPSYTPQPVLADVVALVDGAVRAGLQVHLTTTGQQRPLRSAVELGAYRIVQESLANAARHAPGASVEVALAYEPAVLRIEVVNSRSSAVNQDPDGVVDPPLAGHGLTGMAERAAVVGGHVDAAGTPDGGFRVVATLPTGEGSAS